MFPVSGNVNRSFILGNCCQEGCILTIDVCNSNSRDAQASLWCSTATTVVPKKTFVHARASVGMCDLNPTETVLAAICNTLFSFQPFASVGDKMISSTWMCA